MSLTFTISFSPFLSSPKMVLEPLEMKPLDSDPMISLALLSSSASPYFSETLASLDPVVTCCEASLKPHRGSLLPPEPCRGYRPSEPNKGYRSLDLAHGLSLPLLGRAQSSFTGSGVVPQSSFTQVARGLLSSICIPVGLNSTSLSYAPHCQVTSAANSSWVIFATSHLALPGQGHSRASPIADVCEIAITVGMSISSTNRKAPLLPPSPLSRSRLATLG